MITCRNRDDVAGKGVDLEEQRTHDALDLTRLVHVATLLPDRIELIEEQNTTAGAGVLEDLGDSLRGLAEAAPNDGLIPHNE